MNERNNLVLMARGRNGEFQIDQAEIYTQGTMTGPRLDISVSSRRIGGSPPIRIEGTLENVAAFFDAIHQAIGLAKIKMKHRTGSYILTVNKKGEIK